MAKPSFKVPAMDPGQLGELFVEVAAGIVKAAGPQQSSGAIVTQAINSAALFVETIRDIQRNQ